MKIGQNTTNPVQYYIEKPIFQGQKNAVISCEVGECQWKYAGPRTLLKEAWNEHYRMFHSSEVGVMRLEKQLRKSIWLPGG